MRIDSNPNVRAATEQAATTGSRQVPASSPGGGLATDRAELSPDQARVQSLSAQVNALPEIRKDKVSALQSAVRQGEYNVSSEQTADAMIAEMLAQQTTAA